MVAGVIDRPRFDRAVFKVHARGQGQAVQLLAAQLAVVLGHGKGDDDQDFFHANDLAGG